MNRALIVLPALALALAFAATPLAAVEGPAAKAVEKAEKVEKPAEIDFSKSLLKNPILIALPPDKKGRPRFWSGTVNWGKVPFAEGLRIEKDEKVLFQGRPTARFTFGPFKEKTWWQILQNIDCKAAGLHGKNVRLTFYIRKEKEPVGSNKDFQCVARLPKREADGKNDYQRKPAFSCHQKTPPGDWKKFVVEGKVDAEATFFNFTVQNQVQEQQFWLAGFLLDIVEPPARIE